LYYLINYGFEVYRDRSLAEDPYEHNPKVVDLLQNMEFPKLDGNPLIDNIIGKCWHNKYVTVSELAAHTKTLLNERTDAMESDRSRKKESSEVDKICLGEEFVSNKEFCQDLEKRGFLHVLSSGEPEKIGFTLDWYRHSL
jgi:hypothetical protein